MAAKTIKEIIIMLLVCLVTMLILAIGLYQFIPSKKLVPEVTTYVATEDVQDLLEDDIDSRTDSEEVILTYEVTSSDLKNYQSGTSHYASGKANPFASVTTTTTEEEGTSSEGSTGESGTSSTNNGSNTVASSSNENSSTDSDTSSSTTSNNGVSKEFTTNTGTK